MGAVLHSVQIVEEIYKRDTRYREHHERQVLRIDVELLTLYVASLNSRQEMAQCKDNADASILRRHGMPRQSRKSGIGSTTSGNKK